MAKAPAAKSAQKLPRIGAHTPTSGGMAKRSLGYAETIKAEAIQVFASNPRGWAMPEPNPKADEEFRTKAADMDIATYVHAPFLINLGSPTSLAICTVMARLEVMVGACGSEFLKTNNRSLINSSLLENYLD